MLTVAAVVGAAVVASSGSAYAGLPAGVGIDLSQCTNGGGNPLSPQPCAGSSASAVSVAIPGINGGASTSYKNWVNGNANGQKAHWRENEFIAYRAALSGLSAGSHTLYFDYQVTDTNKHALDYLGSYDATETTATSPTVVAGVIDHANNNNPCADLVNAGTFVGTCTPSAPTATLPIAPADLVGAQSATCGATGTFASGHSQIPGSFKLYAAAGSTLDSMTYVKQNYASGSGCATEVGVSFTIPTALTSNQEIALVWGGHIASADDWGSGNSATNINGSPYHLGLDALDSDTTGAQTQQLASSAIVFLPTISTVVRDSANALVDNAHPVTLGATVHDTATLAGASSTAGGTVTYTLYDNGTCNGNVLATSPVTVANAAVPDSTTFTPTSAGSYSYQAVYGGDTHDLTATGACEPFTVNTLGTSFSTSASPATGVTGVSTSYSDTATFSGVTAPAPTGSVSFTLYSDASCTTAVPNGSGSGSISTVSGVTSATFSATLALVAGTYHWIASYAGDGNHSGHTGACTDSGESIVVTTPNTSFSTSASPATGTAGVSTSYGDTATFSGVSAPAPSGSVTFTLYSDAACTTAVSGASGSGTISTSSGVTSASYSTTLALPAGTYYWIATYGGDGNHFGHNGACGDSGETLTIGKASPTFTTSASPSTGTSGVSTSYGDTATFTGVTGTPPTGSVTFTLYSDAACTAAVSGGSGSGALNAAGTSATFSATLSLAAGTYYWIASYAGDGNNNGHTGTCGDTGETLTIGKASPTFTTSASPSTGTSGVSASYGDTATFTGVTGTPPTGSVTFTLYSDDTCTAAVPNGSGSGSLNAAGTSASFSATLSLAAGTYYWIASYAGDGNNNGHTGTCGDSGEVVVVGTASPTFTTSASPSTGTSGVSASYGDTATFTGVTGTPPTGSVSFTLYSDAACTTAVSGGSGSGSLNAAGTSATFSATLSLAAGTYYWIASYAGDADNAPFAGTCGDSGETLTIGKASPTFTTSASPSTGTSGVSTSYGDTATFTGVTGTPPTGSVTFTLYSDAACTTAVSSGSGSGALNAAGTSASFSATLSLAAGTYYWIASYAGDGNNNGHTGSCGDAGETLTIGKASPTFTTSASPSTGTSGVSTSYGDSATFTGVTGTPPTGSVTFTLYSDDTCTTAVSGGSGSGSLNAAGTSASFSATLSLAAGTYYWIASYAGDTNNNGHTGTCGDTGETLTIGKASPTFTTSASPSTGTSGVSTSYGDSATFTGVTGTPPTGSVTFTLYSNDTCTTAVSGGSGSGSLNAAGTLASFSTTLSLAAGTYYWIASYAGDGNNNGHTGTCGDTGETLTIGKASPTFTTSASPSTGTAGVSTTYGDTATFTGVTGTPPTGSVTFTLYSDAACTMPVPNGSGSGSLDAAGTSASFSASLSLATGTYYWVASYAGDGNNNGHTGTCGDTGETLTIGKASPTFTTSASPSTGTAGVSTSYGDTATFTGVTGTPPTGSVSFTLYSNDTCTTPVPNGSGSGSLNAAGTSASFSATLSLPAGTYYWIASYAGDGNNNGHTGTCGDTGETLTIGKASPTFTTNSSPAVGTAGVSTTYGDTATFSGVTGTPPTGSVTFTLYSDAACTAAVSGGSGSGALNAAGTSASFSATLSLAAGSYYWIASYAGDGNNNGHTGTCGDSGETVVIGKAGPTFTTSASPSTGTSGVSTSYGDTATFTGVTGTPPTGSVTFTLYSDAACTMPVPNGSGSGSLNAAGTSASFSATLSLPAGTYYWIASYAGDSNNNGHTGTCGDTGETLTIGKASPTFTTSASPSTGTSGVTTTYGDSATFTGVTGTPPTGSVSFALYSDAACTTPVPNGSGSGSLNAAGTSASFSASLSLAAGTYYWIASYAGDGNNNGHTGTCGDSGETLTVGKAAPTFTTTAAANSGTAGVSGSFGDTAIFTGVTATPPTGNVTFTLYSDQACSSVSFSGTGAISTSAGVTSASYSRSASLAAGTYYWIASYAGDTNNSGFTGGCGDSGETVTIGKASPTFTTAASPAAGVSGVSTSYGDTATFTGVTLTPPTGSVTFTLYSNATCTTSVANGSASITTSGGVTSASVSKTLSLGVGTYYWVASYAGDSNNNGFTGTCGDTSETVTVVKASPTFTTSATPAGGIAANPASYGDKATFTVPGAAPTGSVSFTLYSDAACTTPVANASGSGTIGTVGGVTSAGFSVTLTLPVGTYYWIASYAGDGNNNGFTGTCGDPGETLTVRVPVSQITPTQTTCAQYASFSASTLSQLFYSLKGNKINQVNPGVFFYWMTVTAAAGANSFTVQQSITTGNFSTYFPIASGSNAFTSSCVVARSVRITQSGANTVVTFTAPSAGTYFIGLKYSPSGLAGAGKPSPGTTVHYVFTTLNVALSSSGVDLIKK